MEIRSIASKKACGGARGANTGKLGCLSLFGTPTHLIALRKGTEILGTADFNLAYLTNLIKKGDAIPIIGASAFEDVSSEDGYYTNSKGGKRRNLLGLPEYKLMFEEGHDFYKEIAKMTTFKSYDYMIGDDEGNWMLANKSNGNYQGFTSGHTTAELTKRRMEGGDPEMKSLVVQFLNRLQWDENYDIVHAENLDFAPDDIPGINGTLIEFETVPANNDTQLSLNVMLAADRNSSVEGLSEANVSIQVNGATANITAVAEATPGNYVFTLDAAVTTGQTVTVTHFNGDTNTTVAESNGVLYRSTTPTSAVVV